MEIAPDTHSQFSQNMAEFSACVPPALQYGLRFFFTFGNFEFLLHPKIIIKQQNWLNFFFLWATLPTLGEICTSTTYLTTYLRRKFAFFPFISRIAIKYVMFTSSRYCMLLPRYLAKPLFNMSTNAPLMLTLLWQSKIHPKIGGNAFGSKLFWYCTFLVPKRVLKSDHWSIEQTSPFKKVSS